MENRRIKGVDDVTTFVARRFTAARSRGGPVERALSSLPVPSNLSGQNGQRLINGARVTLDRELERALIGLDGLTLFTAARSISARVWTLLGPRGDDIQPAVRAVLELGIQKYARWRPSARRLVQLPSFLPAHLDAVGTAFALSEAYATMLAAQRRIGKGEEVPIRSLAPIEVDYAESEIHRLIARLDQRSAAVEDPLIAFGTVSPAERQDMPVPFILGGSFVRPSEVLDPRGEFQMEERADGSTIRTADRVVRWGFIENIEEFQNSVAAYDASLRRASGYGLVDLHAIQHLVSLAIMERYETPDSVSPCLDLLGLTDVPPVAIAFFRDIAGTHPYDLMPRELAPTQDSLARAFDRLLAAPGVIDLTSPTVRRPLIPIGDARYVYDLAAASLISPLFIEQQLPEAERQALTERFEERVHEHLSRHGEQPWPRGRNLRDADGHKITNVDASVKVGDLLVVADCYSSPWSRALDLGTHASVRNRAENLAGKLEKWQRQWKDISGQRASMLPRGVRTILPIVVTAGPEWVPSEAPHLWLTEDVPAILTIPELDRLLARGHLERLPNTVAV